MMQLVGECMRIARRDKGMTLSELAASCNFSLSYLSDIENGRRIPPRHTRTKIANVLGQDVDFYDICCGDIPSTIMARLTLEQAGELAIVLKDMKIFA